MNEKKGMFIRTKDLIIIGLAVVIVFYFAFEIYKIKHQMNFAGIVNQVNSNTAWITNVVNRSAQVQAQQRAVQKPPQPKEVPEKKGN